MSLSISVKLGLIFLLFGLASALLAACDLGKLRETLRHDMAPYLASAGAELSGGSASLAPVPERLAAARQASQPLGAAEGRIAFVSDRDGNDEIYIMDADGANASNLSNHRASDRQPAWSPDGRAIAFASTRDGGNFDIYSLDLESGKLTRLTDQGRNTDPAWSPDGRRIAFVSDRFGDKDVMVMNADGSRQIQLTVDVYADEQPSWSGDGAAIAYVSDSEGQRNIYVMNSTNGSEILSLTGEAADNWQPSWLKSGGPDQLLFTSTRGGNQDLFLVDPVSGEGLRQLTSALSDEGQASWSPDGATILFVSDRENDGEQNIYAMPAAGGRPQRLTPLGSKDQEPKWK